MEELYRTSDRSPNRYENHMHSNFPEDIRTARGSLEIEGDTTLYAACPKCSCVYPPEKNERVTNWPATCSSKRFEASPLCGERLVKSAVQDGESVRTPIRPLVVQNFDSFVARMLSRPGFEAFLDEGSVRVGDYYIHDIKDADAIRELKGPDGKAFMDGYKRRELRLVWSISIDGFNPLKNKTAGKAVSTSSVAMVCLSLPPSLRYAPENIYLYAALPGPREPSTLELNHLIRPLMDMLVDNYANGVFYSATFASSVGHGSRSAVAVHIHDLPGAKRALGLAGIGSTNNLCGYCKVSKADISNFDLDTFEARTVEELRHAAGQWKLAKSEAERETLFNQTGVRWSEFWRLPYFNPIKQVVVDGMHTLFLGLVEYHIRQVLGINDHEVAEEPVDPAKLAAARKIYASNPSQNHWKRVTLPVLRALCREQGIDFPQKKGQSKIRKNDLVDVVMTFLVSVLFKSGKLYSANFEKEKSQVHAEEPLSTLLTAVQDPLRPSADEKLPQLAQARNVYHSDPTQVLLNQFTVLVLKALCVEEGIQLPRSGMKKLDIIQTILLSSVRLLTRWVLLTSLTFLLEDAPSPLR